VPTLADLKRDPERLHQAATLLQTENKKLIDNRVERQADRLRPRVTVEYLVFSKR
jgi:hypothetical protein